MRREEQRRRSEVRRGAESSGEQWMIDSINLEERNRQRRPFDLKVSFRGESLDAGKDERLAVTQLRICTHTQTERERETHTHTQTQRVRHTRKNSRVSNPAQRSVSKKQADVPIEFTKCRRTRREPIMGCCSLMGNRLMTKDKTVSRWARAKISKQRSSSL